MATEIVRYDPGQTDPLPVPAAVRIAEAMAVAAASVNLHDAVLAGRNARTVRAYRADLADFGRFFGAADPAAALDALISLAPGTANAVAHSYKAHLVARDLSAATIARRLAAIRSAVKLAKALGKITWTLEVELPRTQALRDTRGPGDSGWRAVLDLVKADAASGTPLGLRNLAIVRMLHDLGLRRGELESVDVGDLDLGGDPPTVAVVGKGRTEPVGLTMPAPVVRDVKGWLGVRDPGDGPLFVRLDRGAPPLARLNADGVHMIIGQLGKRAGLSRPLKPHGLRHAAITTVLDRSRGDIRAAARFSRHKNLQTLAVYDDARRDMAGEMARLISDE